MAAPRSCASEVIRQAVSQLYRLYSSKVEKKHHCGRRRFIQRWIEAILDPSDLESVRRDVALMGYSDAFDCLRSSLRGHVEQLCIDSLEERLDPQVWRPGKPETTGSRENSLWEITNTEATASLPYSHSLQHTRDSPLVSDLLEVLPPPEEVQPSPPRDAEDWKNISHVLNRLHRTTRAGELGDPPKKEYFRCQHIRALKKSIRQIESGRLPGTSIHRFEIGNMQQREKWASLQGIFRKYKGQLTLLSDTYSGPATDGKSKRKAEEGTQEKSFNNSFCRNFFMSHAIQTYNLAFCDLVYDVPPEVLCDKMKMCCCAGRHTETCVEVWKDVKLYAQFGMLEELDVPRMVAEADLLA